ncbi:MAG: NADH-quinone oxidoreductase subunit J [Deltaproteobacteria bacterium]|nr:NADH-quinone oxidoreductase subunit J [Deltaproteobacteria bacterium]
MSASAALSGFLVVALASAATYVAFGDDLYRVSTAFLVVLFSASGLLLVLEAAYLAAALFMAGAVGVVLLLSFAGTISGSLRKALLNESAGRARWVSRALAMLLGFVLAGSICFAVIATCTRPVPPEAVETALAALPGGGSVDAKLYGAALSGKYSGLFEIIGVLVLMGAIGAAFLLRGRGRRDEG